MMGLIEVLAGIAQPWAELYAGSVPLSTAVEFLHFSGMLVAGGFALSFDRAALRIAAGHAAGRGTFPDELSAVHLPVVIGLGVVMASGFALAAADVETFLPSWAFWAKMGAFALLVVNGTAIRRAGRRLQMDSRDALQWRSLRRGSRRSIALWMMVLFLGVLLTVVA